MADHAVPVEMDPALSETLNRLKEEEEKIKREVDDELKNIQAIAYTQFADSCENLRNIPEQPAPENRVIPTELEEASKLYRRNIDYLEHILNYSSRRLLKEAANKLNSIKIEWDGTTLEESRFEDYKEMIRTTYQKQVEDYKTACKACTTLAIDLLDEVKDGFEDREGISGTANVIINFLYIAVVPMEEIVSYLEKALELMKGITTHDQNSVFSIELLEEELEEEIKKWCKRDAEIQEKQFDFLDALRGHAADQELRDGMKELLERYQLLSADKFPVNVWRFKLYSSVNNYSVLEELKAPIGECLRMYSQVAEDMRTFFKNSSKNRFPPSANQIIFI